MLCLLLSLSLTGSPDVTASVKPAVALVSVEIGKSAPRRGAAVAVSVGNRVYIVTCAHCIANAGSIRVKFPGRDSFTSRVIAVEPLRDLALLEIPAGVKVGPLQVAERPARAGQQILTIGHPANLPWTVCRGTVAAVGRAMFVGDDQLPMANLLQLDANINKGNSGGPVIDDSGRVLGIVVAVHTEAQGIAFAVPVADVAKFVEAATKDRR